MILLTIVRVWLSRHTWMSPSCTSLYRGPHCCLCGDFVCWFEGDEGGDPRRLLLALPGALLLLSPSAPPTSSLLPLQLDEDDAAAIMNRLTHENIGNTATDAGQMPGKPPSAAWLLLSNVLQGISREIRSSRAFHSLCVSVKRRQWIVDLFDSSLLQHGDGLCCHVT
jgi:hypothetical protein